MCVCCFPLWYPRLGVSPPCICCTHAHTHAHDPYLYLCSHRHMHTVRPTALVSLCSLFDQWTTRMPRRPNVSVCPELRFHSNRKSTDTATFGLVNPLLRHRPQPESQSWASQRTQRPAFAEVEMAVASDAAAMASLETAQDQADRTALAFVQEAWV